MSLRLRVLIYWKNLMVPVLNFPLSISGLKAKLLLVAALKHAKRGLIGLELKRHGKVLEEGVSGYLGKKITINESMDSNLDSFNNICSEKSDIAFGSKHWASVYMASTPQQAAELGLGFPGVDEVKEEDDANDDLKLHIRMRRRRRKKRHKEGTIWGKLSSENDPPADNDGYEEMNNSGNISSDNEALVAGNRSLRGENVSKSEVVLVSSSDESEVFVVSSSDCGSDADGNVNSQMNVEKLTKMAGSVRTGGKGTMTRKKKAVHKTTTTDDKRLQSTLKMYFVIVYCRSVKII